MSSTENIWRSKTDDDLMAAAAAMADYTTDGERVIRAELRRRGLTEPPHRQRAAAAQEAGGKAAGPVAGLVLVAAAVFLFMVTISLLGFVLAAMVLFGGIQACRRRDRWLVVVAAGILGWHGIRLVGRDGVEGVGAAFIAGAAIAGIAVVAGWNSFRRPLAVFGSRAVYIDPREARITTCQECGMPAPDHTEWCPTRKNQA